MQIRHIGIIQQPFIWKDDIINLNCFLWIKALLSRRAMEVPKVFLWIVVVLAFALYGCLPLPVIETTYLESPPS